MKPQKKNYYLSLGIAIGLPIGLLIGRALGNTSIGPAIGMAIGVAIGLTMEKKYNKEPLEGESKILLNKLTILSIVLGAVVLVLALIFVFYLMTMVR
jgi:magnesium-transporting ATPase (P-type)